jgi:hypothetical protein
MTLRIILRTESCYGTIHVGMPPVSKFRTLDVELPELEEALRSGGFGEDSYEVTELVGVELLNGTMAQPAAGNARAELPTASEYRQLLDACWAINDRLRITPGMEAIFTGSTNDIDRFRDLLHDLEPAYRTALAQGQTGSTPTRTTGD